VPRPPMAPIFEAQAKVNERNRPHPVRREVHLQQTP